MKTMKKFLRLWITLASLLSFLVGWATLAHSRKPIQPSQTNSAQVAPLPTLGPLQLFGNGGGNGSGLNFLNSNPQPNSSFPLLRTGGS